MTSEKEVRELLHEQWQQLEACFRVLEDLATPHTTVKQGVEVLKESTEKLDALLTGLQTGQWPEPTVPEPDMDTLEQWMWEGIAEATDGCPIEVDGICIHGHRSWFLVLGYV
jgi:hypothetical protein